MSHAVDTVLLNDLQKVIYTYLSVITDLTYKFCNLAVNSHCVNRNHNPLKSEFLHSFV
jgi:hypothetical protein